jgi:hypothetical protein
VSPKEEIQTGKKGNRKPHELKKVTTTDMPSFFFV